ncbi:hypothetical protein GGR52DRAFT_91556 [Hypoxylon sp. FL1284]|nr:hypothetical protein GGR52DRAFT_91556 [Hypoxylon sp. FL1284]
MAPDKTPLRDDSNWAFMYVVLALIPVAFVAIAVYSTRQNTTTVGGRGDIEMAVRAQPSRRPWREPETPQRPSPAQAASSSVVPSPFSGHRASGLAGHQEAKGHVRTGGRGKNPTKGPYEYGNENDGLDHNTNNSQHFENVPL